MSSVAASSTPARPFSGPGDWSSKRWTHLRSACLLAALTTALYLPVAGFDFVNWDDPWYVVENPLIRSWSPGNLARIATEPVTRNYAPVTILSFLIEHTLWGLWPGGYHLVNAALHALNAVLVYFLVMQIVRRRSAALIAAAVFAVHPAHIESVAWISARKGVLSATFILSALLCWLRRERTGRHEAWGLAFLTLALLTKAVAVVVPAVVLSWDVLVRRQRLAAALPRQVVPGFFALMLLLGTMSAQTTLVGGVREHLQLNRLEVLAVDAIILWKYVGKLLWPHGLCVLYDPATSGIAAWAVPAAAGWLLVGWLAVRCRRRFPLVTFSLVTAGLFLVPVLNLFPITTLMNDRYLYLPSIPLLALAAAGVDHLLRGRAFRWNNVCRFVAAAAVFVGLSLGGRGHLPVWRNGISLWRHASANVPQLAVAQIELANALEAAGNRAEAVRVLRRAQAVCRLDEIDRGRIHDKLRRWSE